MMRDSKSAIGVFMDAEDAAEFVVWMRTSDDVCDFYEHITGAPLKKDTPNVDVVDFLYALAETLDEADAK